MNAWVDRLDSTGQPHTSIHRDGHRIGLFPDGWFAYNSEYRWTPPGRPKIGPEPAGPFATLTDAKHFVEAQGWVSQFPYEQQETAS